MVKKFNISKEKLYELYWKEGLDLRQIGKKYGVSHNCIWMKMAEYKIRRKTRRECNLGRKLPNSSETKKKYWKDHPEERIKKSKGLYEYYEKHPEVKEKIRRTLKRKYDSGEIIHPMLGKHHTEKTKRKQRLVKLGKKNPKCSETRKRLFKEGKLKKPMLGKKHKAESIKLMKKNRTGICKGEDSPFWKGGIASVNEIIRGSAEYKEWRWKVFKRDNFTCQNSKCKFCYNKGSGNKVAHHIKSFSKYQKLRFDISNGITLCEKFHDEIRTKEEKYIKIFQNKIENIK